MLIQAWRQRRATLETSFCATLTLSATSAMAVSSFLPAKTRTSGCRRPWIHLAVNTLHALPLVVVDVAHHCLALHTASSLGLGVGSLAVVGMGPSPHLRTNSLA